MERTDCTDKGGGDEGAHLLAPDKDGGDGGGRLYWGGHW